MKMQWNKLPFLPITLIQIESALDTVPMDHWDGGSYRNPKLNAKKYWFWLLPVFLVLSSLFAYAAVAAETAPAPVVPPLAFSWQWVVSLGTVMAAIFALAWVLRRVQSFSSLATDRFRLLTGMALGGKERLMLVQVGEKQLVLGVTPANVRTLCVLEGDERIGFPGVSGAQIPFAARLQEFLKTKAS
jgi:flagellar protein FliO/FliZ